MMKAAFTTLPILVMEDDENDAWFLARALKKLEITNPVHIVTDGEEGVAYLSGEGKYQDRGRFPLPGFIITDLKMPRLNGLEVLKWLRGHPEFRRIPTLILTSSRAEKDVAEAYGFGANSYMVKPSTYADLERLGRTIRDYWQSCEMPQTHQG